MSESRDRTVCMLAAAAFVATLGLSCASASGTPDRSTGASAAEEKPPPSLLGEVTREQIESAEPSWVEAEIEAETDPGAVAELAAVPSGAEVTVYLGTWCSDSRRELGRFWRAVDEAGGELPFAVRYVAVERYPERPPELEREIGLRYVPTFIVERDGAEIGRMVEVSPNGIEADLAALLTGSATGVLSARDDADELGPPGSGERD